MYCPKCKAEFMLRVENLRTQEIYIEKNSNSEIKVVFDCMECGEIYVVTIAQEDLKP